MDQSSKTAASDRICEKIKRLPEYQAAKTIFAYLPMSSEANIETLFDEDKIWGFPRILSSDEMEFLAVSQVDNQTLTGDFHIREPDPYRCPILPISSADLIVIPGVGFSSDSGNRLGRGKGHYDRYLSQFEDLEWRPLLVGVCFSVQVCEVPAEDHDLPVDIVITEES